MMTTPLPALSRPLLRLPPHARPTPHSTTPCRHASLLRRPHRPYTFTQLLTLSDGSTTIQRTTSPLPLYTSAKDTRNHPLWNPSEQKLRNVEQDEAGRLRAFRKRFGRGWDADASGEEEAEMTGEGSDQGEAEDGLMDLISGGYGRQNQAQVGGKVTSKGTGKDES